MTKQEKIQKYLSEPIKIGDDVHVRGLGIQNKNSWGNISKVIEVLSEGLIKIKNGDTVLPVNYKKWIGEIGNNPFPTKKDRIENINFTLESVLFKLGIGKESRDAKYEVKGVKIENLNWNPFVYNSAGKKQYYQRPFVWNLEDNQLLVESIYNNIDCGKILIRARSWQELEHQVEKGETELFWSDIVDSKQRLNALRGFINNEFSDFNCNYWNDLSDMAQRRFTDHQLFSYSQLPENSKDSDVIEQFLKLNFTGKPQSKEHIEFVKEISKKL